MSLEDCSPWLLGLVVVTFDLELGQAIELTLPSSLSLSETDKNNICYLAFPDSNSGLLGDSQFHFRVRKSLDTPPRTFHSEFNSQASIFLRTDPEFLFGFVYFRQVKDSQIRRGYYQKSLILLTYLPLITLFSQINKLIAKKFFETNEISLQVAIHDILQWSVPTPGSNLTLPLLGHLFTTFIPSHSSGTSDFETVFVSSSSLETLTPIPNLEFFSIMYPLLERMDHVWELVLTAEPLVIMATNPSVSSATVQYLTTLIYPLRYSGDYRPFYTIHDSDFKDITGSHSNALPNIILGVTNPFFSKALKHWPTILKLGGGEPNILGKHGKKMTKFKLEAKPGMVSSRKSLLEKDKEIVKKILRGVSLQRPLEVQSALLRRHFLELTQTFMIPLERYMASLMPLAKNISPYKRAPSVKTFSPAEFFGSLEFSGPQLTSSVKGDWKALYQRFFKSPNFVDWYTTRILEVETKLKVLHLESLAEANMRIWINNKEEVEIVDMLLRIRSQLNDLSLSLSDELKDKLTHHQSILLQTLPGDLKSVMNQVSCENSLNT